MDERIAPLFSPFALRSLRLANRIVMAPMTRGFSPNGIPGADVAAYYARRADTGLIITEGVGVDHPAALGGSGVDGDNAPHMYGKARSEEHTSELQSLMRISYAVFCLKKKNTQHNDDHNRITTAQNSK